MQNSKLEVLIGAFVVSFVVVFSVYLFKMNSRNSNQINLEQTSSFYARFNSVDGVKVDSSVKIAGVVVGKVESIRLDTDLMAIVNIKVQNNIKIPNDSSIAVVSSGLLSEKFLEIKPGISEEPILQNTFFSYTQSTINVESLVGKLLFSSGQKK